MSRKSLNQEKLKEVLQYSPETGVFTWKKTRCRRLKVGQIAGSSSGNWGYRHIFIGRYYYSAHRLAWLYVNGTWPLDEIDHINGLRDDNRILNLRSVTKAQNMQNKMHDAKGAHCDRGRWASMITVNKKRIPLGRFDTKEEATAAYILAKKKFILFSANKI